MIQLITGDYHMSFTRYHALTIAVVASMQQIAFAETSTYNIAAAPLSQTMAQIARQNGVTLSADPELLKGKTAPAIRGNHTVDTAFNLALVSSGLQLIKNADGTVYSLKTASVEDKPQARDLGRLRTIDVNSNSANSDDNAVQLPIIVVNTERTGSEEDGYLVKNITGVGIWGERNLQDTPYSMTVITKELIENVQANSMAQIFKMNPLTQDGGDRPTGNYVTVIRGFNSNNAVINGVPLADFYSFTTMEDLEKVETISGATGFLYGGGRVGGAVNYVTKKPTIEKQTSINIGNYGGDQYYGHLDLSGQIDENNIFGYRVNTLYQNGESIADIGKEQKFISLSVDYKPTDDLTLDLNYAHRDLTKTSQKLSVSLSNSDAIRPILDVSKKHSPDWNKTKETNDRVMSNIKWNLNEIFTFRSSLLYEKSDSQTQGDTLAYLRQDGLYDIENTKYSNQPDEFKNYAGNMYLDSKFITFGIQHLLTIGYSENYYKYSIARNWFEFEDFYGITLNQIKNLPLPSANVLDSDVIPSVRTQYKNILMGDDIVFNDHFSALIGINYATVVGTNYSDGSKISKYNKSELTPTLSLMYKPFEDLTNYITYIESLEQGTIVANLYSNANEVLPPLVSKQYEIGAKYNLNESLLLTTALFRIEKANQYSDLTSPRPRFVQDGKQVHQGLELTMTGKITDNLTIFGGGTVMNTEIEKSNNAALEGKKPYNAATKMAKLYAEYNIPTIQELTITGGAYYTGEKYGNALNTDKIPSYTLYDVGLRYKTKLNEYPTAFLLNVSNLTGKNYWASNFYLGDPRTVAFSIKTQF